eukprot:6146174-Amphidinium_carterae.1
MFFGLELPTLIVRVHAAVATFRDFAGRLFGFAPGLALTCVSFRKHKDSSETKHIHASSH